MTRRPPLAPLRRTVPAAPPVPPPTGAFPPARVVPLPGYGPEDVVVGTDGCLYTGLDGGAIVRVTTSGETTVVADTGGRPLGLEPLPDGRLIVCDSLRGLLRVDPVAGTVETLVREVGTPLTFCSNAAVQRDGTIWFTESTSRFDFYSFVGAFLEQRPTGRLMRRDPSGAVDVVLDGLWFANGVALLPDESALLFVETADYKISRLSLSDGTVSSDSVSPVQANLPGFPDNLSAFKDGRVWVALTNPRDHALDRLAALPGWIRKAVWALPAGLQPKPTPITWVRAIDPSGNVIHDFHAKRSDFHFATGMAELDGRLYVASPERSALLALDLP